MQQATSAASAAIAGTWSTLGASSTVANANITVGSVDYNAYADISSIAGLAGNPTGTGALAWSSSAMCTPAHANCNIKGYIVDTNAYVSGYACGPWWVPYGNKLGESVRSQAQAHAPCRQLTLTLTRARTRTHAGYTHTSATAFGTGSFSMYTGCSSTGGGRNLNIVQGQLTFLYYYSSNYLVTLSGNTWPPARAANSGGTITNVAWMYLQLISGQAQTAMGFRQWLYVVPIGGCAACPNQAESSVLILMADAGMGLRVMQNAGFNYPTWTINTVAATGSQAAAGVSNTVDVVGYNKAPNNDHALIGLMVQTVAGRTIAYVTSSTGSIYSFDVSTLTWMNSGRPVYRAGISSTYRGAVSAPRPLSAVNTYCRAPPTDSQTAGGYQTQWPNGYVLASTTPSGATWGTQNAPVYASASFGCPTGKYSSSLATLTCSTSGTPAGWAWASFVAPTCIACAASSGNYCPASGLAPAGVQCPAGFYCTGGGAVPLACSAPGGSWCPPGTAQNAAGSSGWAACPQGKSCAGGSAVALTVQPLQANSVVVVRVGDGSANYGAATQPVFIDEFDGSTMPMTLIQTISLPTLPNGAQQAFSLHPSPRGATSASPGFLSLSADGRFLSLAGFATPPLTPLAYLAGPAIPRVIARIDWLGNVDTSTTTVLGDSSPANGGTAFSILSACSYDGSGFVFTTDYAVNATGQLAQVNYQAFGTQVADPTQIKSFSSPRALAQSNQAPHAFLGGAQPVVSDADGWRQCQFVGNQLVLSHTWSAGSTSDLSAPDVAGAVTDANLGADFSRRWTYSAAVKNAQGFAFFDNNQHLAVCDRGSNIDVFNDPTTTGLCAGTATNISATPLTPVTPTLSSAAAAAQTSIVDATGNCYGVAASRDGRAVFFTTDTPGGFSRIFRMQGWTPGGGAAAPVTIWHPVNNWWLYTPPATAGTANPNVNWGGVANTFQNIFTNGQPIFKGIAQTAQIAQGSVCPAGYATGGGGGACAICPPATYASVGMTSCAPCPGTLAVALLAGRATCTCPPNYSSGGTSGASLVCTACPAGSTSAAGSSTCVCTAQYAVYVSASNSCYTAPSTTPSPSGSPSLTATPSITPTPSPTPSVTGSPSASPTSTPSLSATPSVTPSPTQTPTSTTTPSLSATPTLSFSNTPSQTPTRTGTQTPTPTQTPSPTPIADSLLIFSFSLAPASTAPASATLPAFAIYGRAEVTTAIKTAYASLLGVSLSSITIPNVTDVATGTNTNLAAMGLQRRLQGAPGSKGVNVLVRVNLGKAPPMASLTTMQAALSSPPASFFGPIFAAVVATGWASSPAALGASINLATVKFANTAPVEPISAASGAAAASSSAGSSSVSTGVAVGVVLFAVFVGIWSYRSWAKHGKLPCFRDRAAEKRVSLVVTKIAAPSFRT